MQDRLFKLCDNKKLNPIVYLIENPEAVGALRGEFDDANKYVLTIICSDAVKGFAITQQGYKDFIPEPFATIFLINENGELRRGSKSQHPSPINKHPSRAEDWTPFNNNDADGIAEFHRMKDILVEQIEKHGVKLNKVQRERYDVLKYHRSLGKGGQGLQ